jgi:hypothetical protein
MAIYEQRATLFLDLLGFRSLIQGRREKDILDSFKTLSKFAAQYEDFDIDFQSTAFSDCVVCSTKIFARNNFMPAAVLSKYAGQLALELLSKEILVRGAITVGKLYHRGSVVFGPAMVEAYELESVFAQYPRIVVSEKVFGKINMSLAVTQGAEWWMGHMPFRQDFDGMKHLDVFGPFFINQRPQILRTKKPTIENLGAPTRRLVTKICRRRQADLRISAKYEWLKSYFVDCCGRFGWGEAGPKFDRIHDIPARHNKRMESVAGGAD